MASAFSNRRVVLGLAIAVLGFLAGPVAADEHRIGGAVLDIPASWKSQTPELFVRDFGDYKVLLQITGPADEKQDTFDKNFDMLATTIKELAEENPMSKDRGVTIAGHQIRIEQRCCEYIRDVMASQTLVGVAARDRQIFLLMLELGRGEDEDEDAVRADLQTITRTMRVLPDDKPFELVPGPDDGGLEGAFTTLRTGVRPNPWGGLDFYSDSEIVLFDKAGLYSNEIPTGSKSMSQHCQAVPDDCGLYALKGKGWFSGASRIERREVANLYGLIEVEEEPFIDKGDELDIDGSSYYRVEAYKRGKRFDGVWKYLFAQSGPQGGVAVERQLTLKPDGAFEGRGWAGTSFYNENASGVFSSPDGVERGTYEVEGNTLTFFSAQGVKTEKSIFAPGRGEDGLLIIDGGNYLKQE